MPQAVQDYLHRFAEDRREFGYRDVKLDLKRGTVRYDGATHRIVKTRCGFTAVTQEPLHTIA